MCSFPKNFNSSPRNFLVVKSSKQPFKHGESPTGVSETQDLHTFCTSKEINPFLESRFAFKIFYGQVSLLSIQVS